MALEMPDKLQFVSGFHHSSTAESPDKLRFVGHFWIREQYLKAKGLQSFALINAKFNTIGFEKSG
jgi:hypothetical protein